MALSGLRTAKLLERIKKHMRNDMDMDFMSNFPLLVAVWEQLYKLALDLLPFGCLVLAFSMPWRWPYLARGLSRHDAGWLFQTICPCCVPKSKRKKEGEVRCLWIGQAIFGVCDLVTAMPLALVLLSGLRTRKLLTKLRSKEVRDDYDEDVEYNWKARRLVWKQCGSLCVDLVFVPLALVVLLSGWRSISLLTLMRDKELKGMRKRGKAIRLFFHTLLDVPFILAALVPALTPWRTRALWTALKLWDRKGSGAKDRRQAACEQLVETLKDWAHLPPAALVLSTWWRARDLWTVLKLGSTTPPTAAQRRADVRSHCHETMLDHPHVLFGSLVLLFCPWRARMLWRAAKPWPGATRDAAAAADADGSTVAAVAAPPAPPDVSAAAAVVITADERRSAAREQFGRFLLDVPCGAMAAAVLLSVWRAPLLWRELKLGARAAEAPSAHARWGSSAWHFCCLLRDVPFLLLAPFTCYRLPRVGFKIIAACKRPIEGVPPLTITGARAARDEHGRVRLCLAAHKPADLVATQLRLTAGGADFWRDVEESYGSMASVAKTMLPARVVPKYLTPTGLDASGQTAVELVFTASGAAKPLQKLRDQGDAPFLLQGQTGSGRAAQLLFEFVTRPSAIVGEVRVTRPGQPTADEEAVGTCVDEPGFGPATLQPLALDLERPALEDAKPLQDVVWMAVGIELVEMLVDLVRIIATVALLAAPWRFSRLLVVTFEPVKRWPQRRTEELDAFLLDEANHADESIGDLHAALCTAARGTELAFPAPEHGWRRGRDREQPPPWRGPPLPVCKLYVGLAKPSTREKTIARIRKLDEPLGDLWEALFATHATHRLCVILEAEMLRGVLFPPHWAEMQYALQRRFESEQARARPRRRGRLAPVVAQPVPNAFNAAALLRTVDALRESVASEAAGIQQQLQHARAERRAQLAKWKPAPSAVIKRSASKGRQQVTTLCKGALFDWLSLLGMAILLATVYRAPALVSSLRGVRCWRSVHCRVARQLREVPADMVMLLHLLVLSLAFWQTLEMWLQWSDLLLTRGDVRAAREALARRRKDVLSELCERLCMLLSPLVLWDTYKFVLATLCFGILVPVHLIGKLLHLTPRLCCGARRDANTDPRRLHYWLAAVLWAGMLAFPFVLVWHLAPAALTPLALNTTNATVPPALPPAPLPPRTPLVLTESGALALPIATGGYLGCVLLLGLLSSALAVSSAGLLQKAAPRRVLRWTAANGFALLQVFIECAQLAALPFLALHAAGGLASGADADELRRTTGVFYALRRVADTVLLWQEMTTPALTALVLTAFGALCVWFLLFSLPVVVDDLLRWESRHGRIQHSRLWKMVMFPLHTTLQMTVVMQLIKPLGCTYAAGAPSLLYADRTIVCWDLAEPLQPYMALCAWLGLAFYLLTAHLLWWGDGGLLRQAQLSPTLDVQYSELYLIVGNAVRTAAAIAYLFLHDQPIALQLVLCGLALFLLAWTLGFRRLFRAPACAIRAVTELRAVGEAIAAWAALSCALELLLSQPARVVRLGSQLAMSLPELVCLAGWIAIALVGILAVGCRKLCAARARQTDLSALRECARLLVEVEAYWQGQSGVMGASWVGRAARWRRSAAHAPDVASLCRAVVEVEQHVRSGVQLQSFMTGRRAAWQREMADGVAAVGRLNELVAELRDSVVVVGKVVNAEESIDRSEEQTAALRLICRDLPAGLQSQANSLRLHYGHLYDLLLRASAHADSVACGDEHADGVAAGVTLPTMVVAGAAGSSVQGAGTPASALASATSAAAAPATANIALATPAQQSTEADANAINSAAIVLAEGDTTMAAAEGVVVVGMSSGLLDERFETLYSTMRAALTNFERLEAVREFTRGCSPTRTIFETGPPPRLTCEQLGRLAESVTLNSRRKEVLVALHPYLSDRPSFHSLVEAQLILLWDREDARREVAANERRAWLESIGGD